MENFSELSLGFFNAANMLITLTPENTESKQSLINKPQLNKVVDYIELELLQI